MAKKPLTRLQKILIGVGGVFLFFSIIAVIMDDKEQTTMLDVATVEDVVLTITEETVSSTPSEVASESQPIATIIAIDHLGVARTYREIRRGNVSDLNYGNRPQFMSRYTVGQSPSEIASYAGMQGAVSIQDIEILSPNLNLKNWEFYPEVPVIVGYRQNTAGDIGSSTIISLIPIDSE